MDAFVKSIASKYNISKEDSEALYLPILHENLFQKYHFLVIQRQSMGTSKTDPTPTQAPLMHIQPVTHTT